MKLVLKTAVIEMSKTVMMIEEKMRELELMRKEKRY